MKVFSILFFLYYIFCTFVEINIHRIINLFNMKLKNLLTLCLLGGALLAHAVETHLTIELKSGSKYNFALADKPVITFENGNLVVNGNSETSYSIEGVLNFHFSEGEESKAKTLQANELQFTALDKDNIKISNANAGTIISLFTTNGIVLTNTKADNDGIAVVNLPKEKGVYVLTAGNQSIKIIRK